MLHVIVVDWNREALWTSQNIEILCNHVSPKANEVVRQWYSDDDRNSQ